MRKGEATELRYTLLGYGVPVEMLPIGNSGTVKTTNQSRWVSALRAKMDDREQDDDGDGNDETETIVECPRLSDVIFRKGPTHKNNPGNMHYRELIQSTNDEHAKAGRKKKYQITWRTVKEIEERNGRFLEWSKTREMWTVCTDREKIRIKVAACYKQYNRSIIRLVEQHANRKKTVHASTLSTEENDQVREGNQNQQESRNVKEQNGSSADASVNGATEVRHLKHNYSPEYTYDSKRRKTVLFCGFISNGDTGSNDGDDSCFGHVFFPT